MRSNAMLQSRLAVVLQRRQISRRLASFCRRVWKVSITPEVYPQCP
jgi:hypothetical protein